MSSYLFIFIFTLFVLFTCKHLKFWYGVSVPKGMVQQVISLLQHDKQAKLGAVQRDSSGWLDDRRVTYKIGF